MGVTSLIYQQTTETIRIQIIKVFVSSVHKNVFEYFHLLKRIGWFSELNILYWNQIIVRMYKIKISERKLECIIFTNEYLKYGDGQISLQKKNKNYVKVVIYF